MDGIFTLIVIVAVLVWVLSKSQNTKKSETNADFVQNDLSTHNVANNESSDEVFKNIIGANPDAALVDLNLHLSFDYVDNNNNKTKRTVQFDRALNSDPAYLYGLCTLREAHRIFKLNSMSNIIDRKKSKKLSRQQIKNMIHDNFILVED